MEPTSVLRQLSDISKIRNVGALQEHELEKRREERKNDVGNKTRNQRAPEGISRLEIPKLGEERALPSMRFPEASAAVAHSYRQADRLPDVPHFLSKLGEERALPNMRFPEASAAVAH